MPFVLDRIDHVVLNCKDLDMEARVCGNAICRFSQRQPTIRAKRNCRVSSRGQGRSTIHPRLEHVASVV